MVFVIRFIYQPEVVCRPSGMSEPDPLRICFEVVDYWSPEIEKNV